MRLKHVLDNSIGHGIFLIEATEKPRVTSEITKLEQDGAAFTVSMPMGELSLVIEGTDGHTARVDLRPIVEAAATAINGDESSKQSDGAQCQHEH